MTVEREPPPEPGSGGYTNEVFAEVYAEHSGVVFGVASRFCTPGRAADVTQEVFLRLWQDPQRYDQTRGTLRAFLVTVTRDTAIDVLRADTARQAREDRVRRIPNPEPAEVDAMVLARERTAEIDRALACLTPSRRDAIVTAFYGQITYRQAAAVLGEAEGTIKTRIRKGLTDLYDLIQPSDDAARHGHKEGRPFDQSVGESSL